MTQPLRIAVLGAGHLGRIHMQQWQHVEGATVVGFFDPHPEKRAAITSEFGLKGFEDPDDLLAGADAVDIVTPTMSHHLLAKEALLRGQHVFIEKPVTSTLAEAEELKAIAEAKQRSVQVGHVERFNPAFLAARPLLADPMFIEVHRLAQWNPRGTDVSVVLDLMIHDIDLVQTVVKSEVVPVAASGVSVVSDSPDIANARIGFANGAVANLTASRISMKNMRKCRFFQRDAYIAVDLLARETEIVRMRAVEGEPDPFAISMDLGEGRGQREISFEKPTILAGNAIREELAAFTRSIAKGTPTAVTLSEATEALRTALRVLDGMKSNA
ncbi:MAG: Gfo/Idh/MocA family oxidoreductase [Flavobacteriales bacterium]|nr:Gfo/Idh/MocA family oxidoreductase [Flavobacteriales bacterium]